MTTGEHDRVVVRRVSDVPRSAILRSSATALVVPAALLVGYYSVPATPTTPAGIALRLLAGIVAVILVVGWQMLSVGRADYPAFRAIEGLCVAITLMVVLFASVYVTLSDHDIGAFNEPLHRTDALYFTMTTLTTVGFGDITAETDTARITVMVQMLFNVVVIGASVRLIIGIARRRIDPRRHGVGPPP